MAERKMLLAALAKWLDTALASLGPLRKLDAASASAVGGPELRALLIRLVEAGGMLERTASGVAELSKEQRDLLRRNGVRVGALDLFVPAMLRPSPLSLWRELGALKGWKLAPALPQMPPVLPIEGQLLPLGYRRVGRQALRIDLAEKLLLEAHGARTATARRMFVLDPALARSMGLTLESHAHLLRLAGFTASVPKPLGEGVFGPPLPIIWRWRPPRRQAQSRPAPPPNRQGAFSALAELVG
jgi:ATP-dependent RNA helicase SUPV3L1/SUV3